MEWSEQYLGNESPAFRVKFDAMLTTDYINYPNEYGEVYIQSRFICAHLIRPSLLSLFFFDSESQQNCRYGLK